MLNRSPDQLLFHRTPVAGRAPISPENSVILLLDHTIVLSDVSLPFLWRKRVLIDNFRQIQMYYTNEKKSKQHESKLTRIRYIPNTRLIYTHFPHDKSSLPTRYTRCDFDSNVQQASGRASTRVFGHAVIDPPPSYSNVCPS